jgi:glycosyltransferase involved in cell wall biosynthesis
MDSFSVIVTAHNMESVVASTLRSIEGSFQYLWRCLRNSEVPKGEIVVVDDGSKDATWQAIEAFIADKPGYITARHLLPTSPSCARNAGVRASSGSLLFFLDGDDLFYPEHIEFCLRTMQSPGVGFAKTQVHIADPIHETWIEPINGSVVINFCVRRKCHEAVGGFPDFVLCRRDQGQLSPVSDVFFKFEDMYYNVLIRNLFPGLAIHHETVENLRYPGNSFDRQYEKFQLPFGAFKKPQPEEDNFRLQLCNAIIAHRLHELRTLYGSDDRGFLRGDFWGSD